MVDYTAVIKKLLSDPVVFARYASGLTLRNYQEQVARAVAHSVARRLGLTLVVMFPRQSGKNELQAQLEAYFLMLYSEQTAELVKVSPTWKPQAQNAMRRLERVLEKNFLTRGDWEKEAGYLYRVGRAQIAFFSGAPEANIVGATASLLLEVDEAQDISLDKYDRAIAPMAASTNATRVLWGTAWTGDTLLARELKAALSAEQQDGLQRVFTLSADQVAVEVPEYGKHVAEQVARLGRNHPMVRTQYFNEEINGAGGLFDAARRALMQGEHPEQFAPQAGRIYALTLDVGGAAVTRSGESETPGNHDSSAALAFEIDLSTLSDPLIRLPAYRLVAGRVWEGVPHARLYGELQALIEHWHARHVVVDATGVGAGLAGFLEKTFPGRVIQFVFSAASKSQLGWDFLSAVETGRFKLFRGDTGHPLLARLSRELTECHYEVSLGAGRSLRWGAPTGTGKHDDLLIAAALAVALDGQPWSVLAGATIIPRRDPLEEPGGY
ncbi:MAG: hypothetical protein WBV22_02825 [Anaerolineaceae bacterium]